MRRRCFRAVLPFVALLTVGAAACSSAPAKSSQSAAAISALPNAAIVCKGVTLRFIGLAGEEGNKELQSWRNKIGMKLTVTNINDWGQEIGAIKVGQPYDLMTFTYSQAQRMIQTKIVRPIDTSILPNWDSFATGLKDSPLIVGPDKRIYGIPLFWGDSPYVYSPARVPDPPNSILDLEKPEWKGKFLVDDDPQILFSLIGKADGFASPLLTPSQLNRVVEQATVIVDNAKAFAANYQDAADQLVAGNADLTVDGWEAQTLWAKQKGVALKFGFFREHKGGGWWDGLAIPSTATHAACALAYINEMMSPAVNAAASTDLISGAANMKAVPLLGKGDQIYNYNVVNAKPGPNAFHSFSAPDSPPTGYTSLADWNAAWQKIKAGK